MGFYKSVTVKCLDANGHDGNVAFFTPDGQVFSVPKRAFDGVFQAAETPVDAHTGYDLHLQPGDTLTLNASQVTDLQHAQTLEEAEAILEEALLDKVEPQAGNDAAPVTASDSTGAPSEETSSNADAPDQVPADAPEVPEVGESVENVAEQDGTDAQSSLGQESGVTVSPPDSEG